MHGFLSYIGFIYYYEVHSSNNVGIGKTQLLSMKD